jgi:hypothetical protein
MNSLCWWILGGVALYVLVRFVWAHGTLSKRNTWR